LLRWSGAQSQTGIVDEQVYIGKIRRQARQRGVDRRVVAHVEVDRVHLVRAEFGDQRLQPFGPPAGDHHFPARRHEASRPRCANASGRAGDESGSCHIRVHPLTAMARDLGMNSLVPSANFQAMVTTRASPQRSSGFTTTLSPMRSKAISTRASPSRRP